MREKLVLASSQSREAPRVRRRCSRRSEWKVVPQASLGVSDAEEPHGTSSRTRSPRRATRAAARAAGARRRFGICVEVLDGEPGVHSARFAASRGRMCANNENWWKVLATRTAVARALLLRRRSLSAPRRGSRAGDRRRNLGGGDRRRAPRRERGSATTLIFSCRDFGKTAAELEPEQKNLVSHRGKALRRLLAKLKESV